MKNLFNRWYLLILLLCVFASCNQEDKKQVAVKSISSDTASVIKEERQVQQDLPRVVYGAENLKVMMYTDNGNPKIQDGDYVKLNLICKTSDGELITDTYQTKTPDFNHMYPTYQKGDFNEAMRLIGEGDSATFWVKDKITETDSLGNVKRSVDKNKYTIYNVKILKIWKRLPNEEEDAYEKRKYDIFIAESKKANR